jgi:hypothetical protein
MSFPQAKCVGNPSEYAHEHISIKNKAAFVPADVQSLKVLAIGLVKEDILSLITPDDDVVKSPLKLYARFPCHACEFYVISGYLHTRKPDPLILL